MATEFPTHTSRWPYKPPSSIQLDYSGPLMDSLFFLADGRAGAHTVLRDFSENKNHATLSGSYTRNPDGSINYNDTAAQAEISGSASAGTFNFLHNGIGKGTISAWVRLDASEPDVIGTILRTSASVSTAGIQLLFDDRSSSSRDHQIYIFVSEPGGGNEIALSAAGAYPKNTGWHHIGAVIDTTVSSSSTFVWLYIDGVEVATAALDFTPSTSNHGIDLMIGNRPADTGKFPGDIDNVEIYNKALSAAEVKWLYENRWHAYMPMAGFISSTDPVPGDSAVPWHLLIQGAA